MRKSKYTKEVLDPVASNSQSLGEVLTKLGLRRTGGNYRMISSRLRLTEVKTDHFRGQGWARGKTQENHPAIAKGAVRLRRPDEDVFVANSPETCGYRLVRRLRRLGWKYACHECGITHWRDRPLNLHLDHVNGVNNDNRFENLRFLCPNCHSQTETYCRKGRENKAR